MFFSDQPKEDKKAAADCVSILDDYRIALKIRPTANPVYDFLFYDAFLAKLQLKYHDCLTAMGDTGTDNTESNNRGRGASL